MSATKIEWCHDSRNMGVGCSKCSPGCDHCYAEKFAYRHSKNPATEKVYAGVVDQRGRWTGKINFNFSEKMKPHRVPGKGKRVFVGSMTDIFHPNYPDENRDEIFASIMADYIFDNGHGHTFIILTKRPQAMAEYFAAGPETLLRRWGKAGNGWIIVGDGDSETFEEYADGQTIPQEMTSTRDNLRQDYLWPLPNLWLGVTVCNQEEADAKIPALLATPAAKRFVSIEPMLGPVELTAVRQSNNSGDMFSADSLTGLWFRERRRNESRNDYMANQSAAQQRLSALDWVICGGETGPGARPMHPNWVRSLRDQCKDAEVPFFFKSWGEWGATAVNMGSGTPVFAMFESFIHYCNKAPTWMSKGDKLICPDGHVPTCGAKEGKTYPMCIIRRVGKKRAGRLLDGQEHNEIPEGK